jgi:hypothetical protein
MFAMAGAVLGSVGVDAAVGGRAVVMAGSAPVIPSEPARASVALELTPVAALETSDESFRLVVKYAPRIFYRQPNALGLDRPLFLHRLRLDHLAFANETTTIRSNVEASMGEVDYVGYLNQFAPTPGSPPPNTPPPAPGNTQTLTTVNQSIISYYDVQGTADIEERFDKRSALAVDALLGMSNALDTNNAFFPAHARAGLTPTYRYRLTRTDQLVVPSSLEYHVVKQFELAPQGSTSKNVSIFVWTAEAEWDHRASRYTTYSASGGFMYAAQTNPPDGSSFFPIVTAGVTHLFYDARDLRVRARLEPSLRGTLNLLHAEYRTTLAVQGSVEVLLPHFTAALRGTFYTSTMSPLPTGEPETFFGAEAPFIYSPDPNLALEVGARTFFLAPHLEHTFEVMQLQVWGYGAVTVLFGTRADPRESVE